MASLPTSLIIVFRFLLLLVRYSYSQRVARELSTVQAFPNQRIRSTTRAKLSEAALYHATTISKAIFTSF